MSDSCKFRGTAKSMRYAPRVFHYIWLFYNWYSPLNIRIILIMKIEILCADCIVLLVYTSTSIDADPVCIFIVIPKAYLYGTPLIRVHFNNSATNIYTKLCFHPKICTQESRRPRKLCTDFTCCKFAPAGPADRTRRSDRESVPPARTAAWRRIRWCADREPSCRRRAAKRCPRRECSIGRCC